MPLKAVAFDVDGTLYPNASMYLHSLGLALANASLLRALEDARRQLRAHPDPSEGFHRVQAQIVAHTLGITPERAQTLIEGRVYTRWYRIFPRLRIFPDLRDTVLAFRDAGLKTAVLSDFPIRNRLRDLGLDGLWDCAFSSEETGYLKPHPRPFEVLAEKLGLAPGEILYVGNSYRFDIEGAAAAGMPGAHLTRKAKAGSRAVLSFSKYGQLREFVFRSLGEPGYNADSRRLSC